VVQRDVNVLLLRVREAVPQGGYDTNLRLESKIWVLHTGLRRSIHARSHLDRWLYVPTASRHPRMATASVWCSQQCQRLQVGDEKVTQAKAALGRRNSGI